MKKIFIVVLVLLVFGIARYFLGPFLFQEVMDDLSEEELVEQLGMDEVDFF